MKRPTYTLPSTDAEHARYASLVASSPHQALLRDLALRFYRNGHAFVDDAHAEAHRAACVAWNAELHAAGFVITDRGLRVARWIHNRPTITAERRQA